VCQAVYEFILKDERSNETKAVLFCRVLIIPCTVALSFKLPLMMKSSSVGMKANKQYIPAVLFVMLYKVVLTSLKMCLKFLIITILSCGGGLLSKCIGQGGSNF